MHEILMYVWFIKVLHTLRILSTLYSALGVSD